MKSSRLGQTSRRFCLPVCCSTFFSSTKNQEGTPAMAVTFSLMVVSVISFIFFSHSSISAISRSGVRTKLVQRSEEHTSELQSRPHLVCRLLLEKKKTT